MKERKEEVVQSAQLLLSLSQTFPALHPTGTRCIQLGLTVSHSVCLADSTHCLMGGADGCFDLVLW